MNIAIRKLAKVEKEILAKENEARREGYLTCPIDREFNLSVKDLMRKVRAVS